MRCASGMCGQIDARARDAQVHEAAPGWRREMVSRRIERYEAAVRRDRGPTRRSVRDDPLRAHARDLGHLRRLAPFLRPEVDDSLRDRDAAAVHEWRRIDGDVEA